MAKGKISKNTISKTKVKKTTSKKVAAKKIVAKKAVAKKVVAKKVTAKKITAGKSSVKKAVSIKVVAKTPALKLNTVKPTASKKSKLRLLKRSEKIQPEVIIEKKVKKFKPNKKVKFSVAELKHFREIIVKERKAIIESAKANMASLVDNETGEYKGDNLTYSTHMAEQGTDEMEREKNYLFVQRDEKYLGYLQDALMRIDQGTYGICIDCKDDNKNLCRTCPLIQTERLELVPITQHCIECKNLRG